MHGNRKDLPPHKPLVVPDNSDLAIIFVPGALVAPRAQDDVIEIGDYFSSINPSIAHEFYSELSETVHTLTEMPHIGSPRDFDETKLRGMRQWPVNKFRHILIYYRPLALSSEIYVLRILHSSRNIPRLLRESID